MSVKIHPTAVVDSHADLGADVSVGPFCVIDAGAVIGDRSCIAARSSIYTNVHLGCDNQVSEGAVIGGLPQHLKLEQPGGLRIGDGNVFRENSTVHRSMHADGETVIGDGNFIMINTHVAHDCRIGSRTILANNVLLAGHVEIGDSAYLSGGAGVHQFCRVGRQAMVGGQAHITQDVPPFVTVDGYSSRVVGLNLIGLRRSGFTTPDIHELKRAYRVLYRTGLSVADAVEQLREQFPAGVAAEFAPFIAAGERGIVAPRREAKTTLRIYSEVADESRRVG
ncbi:MAG: acyl-ACP--UDP-N-acetylglucosamine O-acyltransferase [Pirellulaceae bacterium]|nr:acyl-ACP--UDP-N-acetylglucosamine O-acyltransferase [Pirellulaceae bacterium]MDP7015700.1 acyl-ACP--UDP-N-acetylglucosamine O-acyltransferase [Pirellulaceae bacterium]